MRHKSGEKLTCFTKFLDPSKNGIEITPISNKRFFISSFLSINLLFHDYSILCYGVAVCVFF